MKKLSMIALAAGTLLLNSCGTMLTQGTQTTSNTQNGAASVLGDILGAATNGQTLGNVLGSVLGMNTMTQKNLIGTWTYSQPGVAFTSDNLLAQAGGEVAATTIKQKVLPVYQKVGISAKNTQIQFKEDGTYTAVIAGRQLSGNYTFDAKTSKVVLSSLLLNLNCYAKRNSDGIALLFESSKLLTLLQTMSALSGNTSVQTIGDLSKNYDGLRLGFDFK